MASKDAHVTHRPLLGTFCAKEDPPAGILTRTLSESKWSRLESHCSYSREQTETAREVMNDTEVGGGHS